MTKLTRRSALAMLGTLGLTPRFIAAHAAALEDRKLVFVILRGALDGLATLIPDDDALNRLRAHTIPNQRERLDLGNDLLVRRVFRVKLLAMDELISLRKELRRKTPSFQLLLELLVFLELL